MTTTMQTDTQNVLQHGISVWAFTQRIMNRQWEGMKIPKWLSENKDYILANLHDTETIENYNIYHDCGKPFCLHIDSDGRRHYPNHAEVSYNTYLAYFECKVTATLIRNDMLIHTARTDQINQVNLSKKDLLTLLITALAEVHSNAEMFGGIESISFKMKYKKIEQRGNQIIKNITNE